MNIFILHENPKLAAEMLCDSHIVKMPLETAQMLSTVLYYNRPDLFSVGEYSPIKFKRKTLIKPKKTRKAYYVGDTRMYAPTHKNHPCTIWASDSLSNYCWLISHGIALCDEYGWRYGKPHSSRKVIRCCSNYANQTTLLRAKRTNFITAMPDQYKTDNAITSYRNYYIGEKSKFAKWAKHRAAPDWYANAIK